MFSQVCLFLLAVTCISAQRQSGLRSYQYTPQTPNPYRRPPNTHFRQSRGLLDGRRFAGFTHRPLLHDQNHFQGRRQNHFQSQGENQFPDQHYYPRGRSQRTSLQQSGRSVHGSLKPLAVPKVAAIHNEIRKVIKASPRDHDTSVGFDNVDFGITARPTLQMPPYTVHQSSPPRNDPRRSDPSRTIPPIILPRPSKFHSSDPRIETPTGQSAVLRQPIISNSVTREQNRNLNPNQQRHISIRDNFQSRASNIEQQPEILAANNRRAYEQLFNPASLDMAVFGQRPNRPLLYDSTILRHHYGLGRRQQPFREPVIATRRNFFPRSGKILSLSTSGKRMNRLANPNMVISALATDPVKSEFWWLSGSNASESPSADIVGTAEFVGVKARKRPHPIAIDLISGSDRDRNAARDIQIGLKSSHPAHDTVALAENLIPPINLTFISKLHRMANHRTDPPTVKTKQPISQRVHHSARLFGSTTTPDDFHKSTNHVQFSPDFDTIVKSSPVYATFEHVAADVKRKETPNNLEPHKADKDLTSRADRVPLNDIAKDNTDKLDLHNIKRPEPSKQDADKVNDNTAKDITTHIQPTHNSRIVNTWTYKRYFETTKPIPISEDVLNSDKKSEVINQSPNHKISVKSLVSVSIDMVHNGLRHPEPLKSESLKSEPIRNPGIANHSGQFLHASDKGQTAFQWPFNSVSSAPTSNNIPRPSDIASVTSSRVRKSMEDITSVPERPEQPNRSVMLTIKMNHNSKPKSTVYVTEHSMDKSTASNSPVSLSSDFTRLASTTSDPFALTKTTSKPIIRQIEKVQAHGSPTQSTPHENIIHSVVNHMNTRAPFPKLDPAQLDFVSAHLSNLDKYLPEYLHPSFDNKKLDKYFMPPKDFSKLGDWIWRTSVFDSYTQRHRNTRLPKGRSTSENLLRKLPTGTNRYRGFSRHENTRRRGSYYTGPNIRTRSI